jgi:hypothetical protein
MKNLLTIVLFVTALFSVGCAQEGPGRWLTNGSPATDSPDWKAKNGFGAALVVVKDPKQFVDMWYKPDFPDFDTVKEAHLSDEIGAFIMFAGCKPGPDGKCNTKVDYSLIRPDGELAGETVDQIVWNDAPPPPQNTHISKASMVLTFTEANTPGRYKVKAKVYDKNADISLSLETHFDLK